MIDVLLVSPPFEGLIREPLGLYYLGGSLKENGISVQIIDFNVDLPTKSWFETYLRSLKPKIVGLTSYTFNFSAALSIMHQVKKVDSSAITVMGGVHASALPESILRNTIALDYIVMGEGEQTFLEFCQRSLNKENCERLNGLAFRRDGAVIVNPPNRFIENLDELPMANRELLPLNKYPVASVQTSRGCPYDCIFCNVSGFYGRRLRLRDASKVAEECSLLTGKYRRSRLFFFGDAFTFNPSWVEEFCGEILRRRLKFQWGCETRVDNVSLSMLRKMREAGCTEIQYGIDYGDEKVLERLGKQTSTDTISDAVNWAKQAGLFVGAFFIFDVPGEDERTMENTFDLIQRVPVDAIEVNLLTPYPGTKLWSIPGDFRMRIIEGNFDYYTTKKYVMENLDFPRERFIPAFKRILKRLNLVVPEPGQVPEIYDFLKRDIKTRAWRDEPRSRRKLLKL